MQFKWLEDFVSLAKTRNFTRAARQSRHVSRDIDGRGKAFPADAAGSVGLFERWTGERAGERWRIT